MMSPDLVLAVRGQKKKTGEEGKGEEETRSGKIRIETSAIGCSMDAKAPRVCYFFRSQCQKYAKEVLLTKKNSDFV